MSQNDKDFQKMVAKPAADMQTLSYVWHLVAWVVFFWNGTIIISRYIISRPQVFTEGLLLVEIFITSHLIFYFINKEVFFSFLQAIVLVRFYSSYTGTKILWN